MPVVQYIHCLLVFFCPHFSHPVEYVMNPNFGLIHFFPDDQLYYFILFIFIFILYYFGSSLSLPTFVGLCELLIHWTSLYLGI